MRIVSAQEAYNYAKTHYPVFPKDWHISKNFEWNEVFVKELKSYGCPPLDIFQKAVKASIEFQKIRDYLKLPMTINCWYRCQLHNEDVRKQGYKPAMHSAHLYAMAMDYTVKGLTPPQVRVKLLEGIKAGKFRVRIEGNTATWVHNDIGSVYLNNYVWGIF